MIQIKDVHLAFGHKVLFGKISEVISPLDRIALVGSNGSGKTTLLKMLMGEVEPDSGTILKPDFATVGYLPQDGISAKGCTLEEEAQKAFSGALDLKKHLDDSQLFRCYIGCVHNIHCKILTENNHNIHSKNHYIHYCYPIYHRKTHIHFED